MVPTDIRLMLYGLVILVLVLTRVDGTIVKPISDRATKSVDKASLSVDLVEPTIGER